MAKSLKFGAGIWMFGQFVDRYATDAYGPPVDTLKAIDRAGEVGELVALDVNYPFSNVGVSAAQVKAALERNQLERTRCNWFANTASSPALKSMNQLKAAQAAQDALAAQRLIQDLLLHD